MIARVERRAIVAGLACAVLVGFPTAAYAGSYLDRASVLVVGAARDNDALRVRMNDKELAKVIHTIASARSAAAAKMEVPSSVAKAHPHLLLLLAHAERAAESAVDQNFKTTVEGLEAARREDKMFRSLLKELGFILNGDVR